MKFIKNIICVVLCLILISSGTMNVISNYGKNVYGDEISQEGNTPTTDTDIPDILFIGNSMTFYNNMRNIVKGIAEQKGKEINCNESSEPGYTLIVHSKYEKTINAIKEGGYEYVVLQDIVGSFDQDNLLKGAEDLIKLIRQYNPNAKILFYAPWPVKPTLQGEYNMASYFTEGYYNAATKYQTLLAPAVETFYDIYVNDGLDYYCLDGKHPTPLATFISAATIYYTIFDEEYQPFDSSLQEYFDTLINENVAHTNEGILDTYSIDILNLIMKKANHYSSEVNDALEKGLKYTSIAGEYKNPDAGHNPDNLKSKIGIKTDEEFFGNPKYVIDKNYVVCANQNSNLAKGCKAYASTEKKEATFATDGDLSTRWESEFSNPQWIYVDLGSVKNIKTVGFSWENAYASKYYIQISEDSANWKTVSVVEADQRKTVRVDLGNTYSTRYVRMLGTKRGTSYGYSIYEMAVWGPDENFVTVKDTKIKSAVKKKKAKTAKIKLKKIQGAFGYQIKYAPNKKLKNFKLRTYKKSSFTLKKLKKNKKYYIKVRVVKKMSGKKYYGNWTKKKVVKFK